MRVTNTVVQLSTNDINRENGIDINGACVCVCVFLLVIGEICSIKDNFLILHWISGFSTHSESDAIDV